MNRTHFDRTATQSEDDLKRPSYDDLFYSPNQAKLAILLVNLGSPYSTSVRKVRSYLDEFLSNDRVHDLPKRPKWFVQVYRLFWRPEGSP